MKIEKIYISLELDQHETPGDEIDYEDTFTDVIVRFNDQSLFTASFFTFQNLMKVKEQSILDGNYLNGKYFWANGLVLIDSCTRQDIEEVVQHLLNEGDFEAVFIRLE